MPKAHPLDASVEALLWSSLREPQKHELGRHSVWTRDRTVENLFDMLSGKSLSSTHVSLVMMMRGS